MKQSDTEQSLPVTALPLIAISGTLLAYFAVQVAAFLRAGGVFEYPLDDVYIHLAMAAEIGRGGYGVNEGEFTSAASSILYPVLLSPFPDTQFQRFLPMFWCLVGLGISCALWGRIIAISDVPRRLAIPLAFVGPALLGSHAAAFSGLEHTLHAAASLAMIYGIVRMVKGDPPGALMLAGIVLSPLFRFEGVALSLLSAAVIFISGRRALGLGMVAAAIVPVLAFGLFLTGLGLDPLPNSVLTKLSIDGTENMTRIQRYWAIFNFHLTLENGLALGVIAGATLVIMITQINAQSRLWMALGVTVILAALAHLLRGKIGFLDRYEHYALMSLTAGSIALAGLTGRKPLLIFACIPLVFSGALYLKHSFLFYPWTTRGIYLQQTQMARFTQDYYKAPVALNDLGRVVWGNDHYVLDLWGLANDEARRIRLSQPPEGWATELADRRDVKFAMIYDDWLADALGDDWTLLGNLKMTPLKGILGSIHGVDFYARDADTAAKIRPLIAEWVETLPLEASFVPATP